MRFSSTLLATSLISVGSVLARPLELSVTVAGIDVADVGVSFDGWPTSTSKSSSHSTAVKSTSTWMSTATSTKTTATWTASKSSSATSKVSSTASKTSSTPAKSSSSAAKSSSATSKVSSTASLSASAAAKSSSSAVKSSSATSKTTSSASKSSASSSATKTSATPTSMSKSASSSKASASVANLSSVSSKGFASISSASRASASSTGTSTKSSTSSAASATSTGCTSVSGDAPYSLSCSELASVITFPNGFEDKAGGIVFLVHGTGSTGEETWGSGPYNAYLPTAGAGYDIAWFTSPTRSLGDAQVNAEYIAYNIKALAQKSKTGKVFLIGHSQGNINIQWALEFWPSMRQYVSGFSSLAGDFHGTAEGPLLCTFQDIAQGGCEPSVFQQSVGSYYLAAQNAQGGSALVTTTSLYTLLDDIIQPEVVNPTSDLPGATVISVQTACPGYVTDHFGMTVAAPAYFLTLDALEHGGAASLSRFNATTQCSFLASTTIPNPFVEVPGVIKQIALDAISVLAYAPKVTAEPELMAYVCAKGAASAYCESS